MKGSGLGGRVVARVASKLFATTITESSAIGETLERVTNPALKRETVRSKLGPAIDAGIPGTISDADLWMHPLAIWVETCLGVQSTDAVPAWHRAPPLTVTEACRLLSADAGRDIAACNRALRELLLVSSMPERERVPGHRPRSRASSHSSSTSSSPGQAMPSPRWSGPGPGG